jgi:hypothetical protein
LFSKAGGPVSKLIGTKNLISSENEFYALKLSIEKCKKQFEIFRVFLKEL